MNYVICCFYYLIQDTVALKSIVSIYWYAAMAPSVWLLSVLLFNYVGNNFLYYKVSEN